MFLITTGNTEFWGKDDKYLLLGGWCFDYANKKALQDMNCQVMEYPWDDAVLADAAAKFCDDFYEAAIVELAGILNAIHEEKHDVRYWRIIVGPWLLRFVHVVYDRYFCLKTAFDDYPDLETIGLNSNAYRTMYDWYDFANAIESDLYNLQLYTRILEWMGSDVVKKNPRSTSNNEVACSPVRYRLIRTIRHLAKRIHDGFDNVLGNTKLIRISGLFNNKINELKLCASTGFTVWPMPREIRNKRFIESIRKRNSVRSKLRNFSVSSGSEAFANLFSSILPDEIPLCYLEGYTDMLEEAKRNKPQNIRVLASVYGWKSDEMFKFTAANAMESGCRLIGSQHGGAVSGIAVQTPMEKHIVSVVDEFCTFGQWAEKADIYPNAVSCPSPDMQKLLDIETSGYKQSRQVLYVGTTVPRFFIHFKHGPLSSQYLEYQDWQSRFIRSLSDDIRVEMLLRLTDTDWNSREVLSEHFRDLQFDDFSTPFIKQVLQSRVVVVDNLNTTFTEALLLNRPTLIFLNPAYYRIHKEADRYLDKLMDAGILFYDPQDAAVKLIDIFKDPEAWWNETAVQNSRIGFLQHYILRKESWLSAWKKVLDTNLSAPK